jgi:hypothetical protein
VTGCGTAWCTGHARFVDRPDKHVSTPHTVGERTVWLVQDADQEPRLLILDSGSTEELSLEDGAKVGIDAEKVWPGLKV